MHIITEMTTPKLAASSDRPLPEFLVDPVGNRVEFLLVLSIRVGEQIHLPRPKPQPLGGHTEELEGSNCRKAALQYGVNEKKDRRLTRRGGALSGIPPISAMMVHHLARVVKKNRR